MQPYQSELFRFVTQRPIQQIKSDQLKRRIVPCYMEPPPTNSWYARMLRLRQRPDPYERMLQEAVKLINETSEETNESYSGNFVRRLFDKLEFPIWKYAEEL